MPARATRSRVQAKDNLIRSEKRLVAVAGVSGLAVIETADALLVVDRENSEAVRGVVDRLVTAGRREAAIHAREVRPWGEFTVLQEEAGYKVKEVVVDGARPADLAVPSRPRRDLGGGRGRGAGRARRRDAAAARGPELTVPRGTRHRLSNPSANAAQADRDRLRRGARRRGHGAPRRLSRSGQRHARWPGSARRGHRRGRCPARRRDDRSTRPPS